MLIGLILPLALAAAVASPTPAPAPAPAAPAASLPQAVSGDWQIVETESGKVLQDCTKMQRFALSDDRQSILLTEPWAQFSAEYRIVRVEPGRMLTIIEDEKRKTDSGNPVLWWFEFRDSDHFRFRRYDWPSDAVTPGEWTRCKGATSLHN